MHCVWERRGGKHQGVTAPLQGECTWVRRTRSRLWWGWTRQSTDEYGCREAAEPCCPAVKHPVTTTEEWIWWTRCSLEIHWNHLRTQAGTFSGNIPGNWRFTSTEVSSENTESISMKLCGGSRHNPRRRPLHSRTLALTVVYAALTCESFTWAWLLQCIH